VLNIAPAAAPPSAARSSICFLPAASSRRRRIRPRARSSFASSRCWLGSPPAWPRDSLMDPTAALSAYSSRDESSE